MRNVAWLGGATAVRPRTGPPRPTATGAFEALLAPSDPQRGAPAGAAGTPVPATLLLAVQAAAGDGPRRRGLARAETLLDELEALHEALAEGTVGDATLARLQAGLAGALPGEAEPQLAVLLAEIELRVAVELAKRTA